MNTQEIEDVLALQRILDRDDTSRAGVIAALIAWRDTSYRPAGDLFPDDPGTTATKPAKRGKSTPEPAFEPTPDPSVTSGTDEPDF